MTKSPPPTPPASGRGEEQSLAPLPLAGGVGGGQGSGQFKPRNTSRAKELRNNATTAERALWTYLSQRQRCGYQFSRQMPVGPYFADFLCREAGLIVEVDGFSHEARQDYDAGRDTFLKQQGFSIVRFTNDDVRDNLEGVVAAIDIALGETNPPPAPPASGRGEITLICKVQR